MRARSAVFDLYGDHLQEHGYWAPIAAVVTLLGSCGVRPAATRTAVSRMVAEGWLEPQEQQGARGYAARRRARERLEAAHDRIYQAGPAPWGGSWHVVVVDQAADRGQRDRVGATLGFLGYGRLAPQTWLAPRRARELAPALTATGVGWEEFTAHHDADPVALASRVWDLSELAERYRRFMAHAPEPDGTVRAGLPPEQAYPVRADLVHRWRTFLFLDPDLPVQALPADWPGAAARARFLEAAALLRPAARIFVDDALAAAGAPRTGATR